MIAAKSAGAMSGANHSVWRESEELIKAVGQKRLGTRCFVMFRQGSL